MKKIFLSLFLLLAISLLVACNKEKLSPGQEETLLLERAVGNIKTPLSDSKILINSTEAPYGMQQLASYGTEPTFFKVTKYKNYNQSGFYLYYKGQTVLDSYLEASKLVGGNFNCSKRGGSRMDNAALIECETSDAIIKIAISQLNSSTSGVEVNWMVNNE